MCGRNDDPTFWAGLLPDHEHEPTDFESAELQRIETGSTVWAERCTYCTCAIEKENGKWVLINKDESFA